MQNLYNTTYNEEGDYSKTRCTVYIFTLYIYIYIYSKTSLDRPFTGMNFCEPFREVVKLENIPKYN